MALNTNSNSEKLYISIEQKEYLLDFLLNQYQLDLNEYSEASVRRRITKMMNDLNLKSTEQLANYLQNRPNGKNEFLQKFTVNVTEMFRDPSFFEFLKSDIFPKLNKLEIINIWSAGCSSGEETISLAIFLHEAELLHKCNIIGSDISRSILKKAKANVYPGRNVQGYSKAYEQANGLSKLDDYFVSSGDNISFEPFLLEKINYQPINLMNGIFYRHFDLILCRNVLIYFQASLQNKVLDNFYRALKPEGYLGLGSKESILFYQKRENFQEINGEHKVYRKFK
tara:strand:- start:1540 stop:2388 length:849 start_codon:yes stop_codon:yes gene_type:complete